MEMKAILIKSFLLIEVVLFWTVILPVAALLALGVAIRKRTLWGKRKGPSLQVTRPPLHRAVSPCLPPQPTAPDQAHRDGRQQ